MADITKAYQLMVQACNDPNIGYSQSKRRTISLGVNYYTYCDCSSLISWALTGGGFFTNNPWFTTHNERAVLKNLGFEEVSLTGEWMPGDVLWKTGHTEVVYEGRVTMGAHTDGIAFADQVSINSKPTSPSYYESCLRYPEPVNPDPPVKTINLAVVAALCGNFWVESHVNPTVYEGLDPSGAGYGLGQWSFGRRDNLFAWMASHGYDKGDGDGQIEFLIYENEWIDKSASPLHFDSLMDWLTTDNTDIDKLTETYMVCWERPGVPALEERQDFAHQAYTYLQQHGSDKVNWITGNRYLSIPEALNNCIRVYQKLALIIGGDEGGEGWSNLLRWGIAREIYRRRLIWR